MTKKERLAQEKAEKKAQEKAAKQAAKDAKDAKKKGAPPPRTDEADVAGVVQATDEEAEVRTQHQPSPPAWYWTSSPLAAICPLSPQNPKDMASLVQTMNKRSGVRRQSMMVGDGLACFPYRAMA